MSTGNNLVRAIRMKQKPHHDTLYCHPSHKDALVHTITGTNKGRVDNIQIAGLDVVTHRRFKQPIVCRKGEVFNLTSEYADGTAGYF